MRHLFQNLILCYTCWNIDLVCSSCTAKTTPQKKTSQETISQKKTPANNKRAKPSKQKGEKIAEQSDDGE